MIPSSFEYVAVRSIDEAVGLLARYGDEAKLLAGGHSLIPLMKLRLSSPSVLVDIGQIAGLAGIIRQNGSVAIGAGTTHTMVEQSDLLQEIVPLLPQTARHIGDRQVRNCGTIGGSLAHADPAADLPATILALEATLVARSTRGERLIPSHEYFVSLLTTALQPDEMLTEIRVPVGSGRTGSSYQKFENPASGYAVVGIAATVSVGDGGTCREARVAITGAGTKAVRALAVEEALRGQELSEATVTRAAQHAAESPDLILVGDLHASESYRAHLCRVLTKRAVLEAASRARTAS
jgi:aerobic carbon-monoxide dehydrogenase medium subunit